jgi:hypothetical protein
MALAVALATQCPYCLEIHKGSAINAGATKEGVGGDDRVGLARRCCHYARYAPNKGKLTAPRRGHLGLKKDSEPNGTLETCRERFVGMGWHAWGLLSCHFRILERAAAVENP